MRGYAVGTAVCYTMLWGKITEPMPTLHRAMWHPSSSLFLVAKVEPPMTPALLTIASLFGVAALTTLGALRDLRRAILALAGTLLGASLVYTWSDWLNERIYTLLADGNSQAWAVNMHLFAFGSTVLVVGYGGSLLFNNASQIKLRERAATTLLGLLNGVLVVACALRFAVRANGELLPLVRESTPARVLYDALPYVLLAVPVIVATVIVVRGVAALSNRAPQRPHQASAAPRPAAPQGPPPQPRA